jgi:hypothetical protein
MSELQEYLRETKLNLLRKQKSLQESIEKCALPGYITVKNIRGKETSYLQFRDNFYKIVSVHLSREKLIFCQNAFNEKKRLEDALTEIDHDLHLLSLVDVSDDPSLRSSATSGYGRLLDNAVGISPRHKYLFYLTPKDAPGEYDIHYFAKKQLLTTSMIFVNEGARDRIRDYITSAACIVDEVSADVIEKEIPLSGQYRTGSGILFKYSPDKSGLSLSFVYKKKKYEIEYEPYTTYSGSISRIELARMGFFIESHIRINAFAEGIKEYYDRKQNVSAET